MDWGLTLPLDTVPRHDDRISERNKRLLQLLREGVLCDITLIVEGHEIKAHKIVLAAASDFFKIMFCSDFTESAKSSIDLPSLKYQPVFDLIQYMYGDNDVFEQLPFKTISNLEALVAAANYLQVPSIVEKAEDVLKSKIDKKNCFDVLKVANMYDLKNLEKKALSVINEHFGDEAHMQSFLAQSSGFISMFLSYNDVHESEDELLAMILRWIKVDICERLQYASVFLQHIRLGLVSSQVLADAQTVLMGDPECEYRFKEFCKISAGSIYDLIHSSSNDFKMRSLCNPFVLRRTILSQNKLVDKLKLTGELDFDRELDYNTHITTTDHLRIIKKKIGSSALHAHEDIDSISETINSFDEKRMSFQCEFEELPESLDMHALVPRKKSEKMYWLQMASTEPLYRNAAYITVNNYMFAAGGEKIVKTENGYSLRTVADVWMYSSREMCWKQLPHMNFPRSRFALAICGRYLYAIGGRRGTFSTESHIERLDLYSLQWEVCSLMTNGYFENIACTDQQGKKIYVAYWKDTEDLLYSTQSLIDILPRDHFQPVKIVVIDTVEMKQSDLKWVNSISLPNFLDGMTFTSKHLIILNQNTIYELAEIHGSVEVSKSLLEFRDDVNRFSAKYTDLREFSLTPILGQKTFLYGFNESIACFLVNVPASAMDSFSWHRDDCQFPEGSCTVHSECVLHHCALYNLMTVAIDNWAGWNEKKQAYTRTSVAMYPFFYHKKSMEYCGFMAHSRQSEKKANAVFLKKFPEFDKELCQESHWAGVGDVGHPFFQHDGYEDYSDGENPYDFDEDDDFDFDEDDDDGFGFGVGGIF